MRFYDEMYKNHTINFKRLKNETKHPYVSHLLNERIKKWSSADLVEIKNFYQRILMETYAQRNAIVHQDAGNDKSLVALNQTLPWLLTRFRRSIFIELQTKIRKLLQN